jgi:hypothetical protein
LSIAAAAFSFWFYKDTIPPVTPFKKNLLASLRSVSLILVLFILFEPLLDLTYQKEERPLVAVLVDRSESMSISDSSGSRPSWVHQVTHSEILKKLSATHQIDYFSFSDALDPLRPGQLDSLTFGGSQTDIAAALESLKKKMLGKNFAAVILLTDGQYNLGVNPASYASVYGYPVYTVGIGDAAEPKDIAITQVVYNDIVYLNNKIPVDVSLVSFGYKGKPVSVQLLAEGRVIQTRYLNVPEDGTVLKASFDFQAEKTGLQKFVVSVSPLADELTDKNNSKAFYIKVVKSKVSICLISGSPGPDHSFLYKVLAENPDIHVKAFVEKKDGSFMDVTEPGGGKPAEAFDCYIFNNYPTSSSDMGRLQTYVHAIQNDRRPFMLFYGSQLDVTKYRLFSDAAPVEIKPDLSLDETLVYPSLSLTGKNSVIMKVTDNASDAVQQWQELPPVWIGKLNVIPSAGSDILARVDMSKATNVIRARKDIPLIVSKKTGQNKSIFVVPYGLWKSYFVMAGLRKTNTAYVSFISNAVKWLTTMEDTKPVIVTVSKNIYRNGEKVLFNGQVYDEQYNPVNDASVKVTIKAGNRIHDVALEFAGNGRYGGQLNGLEVGDYEYEGEAVRQDVLLGKDRGKFAVEDFSVELLRTAMNEKLLKAVAAESGGHYFAAQDFSDIEKHIQFQPLQIEEKKEIELWNKIVLLFVLAGLLAAEWFIRKRLDML